MSVSLINRQILLTVVSSVLVVKMVVGSIIVDAAEESDHNSVAVRGATGAAKSFTVDDLRKLPRTEIETKDRKGQPVKYAGVVVSELLKQVDAAQGETLRGEWLRAFVTVDARDEYRAVFALPEFDAEFTDRIILLAYERNGEPLDNQYGPLQIVVPGEKKHARWVRMVKQIRVYDSAWIKE